MMSARGVMTVSLGALLAVAATVRPASACRLLPAEFHHIEPELAAIDTAAPSVPTVVEVDAYRRNGMTCTQASCVANTCGDTGTVRIELAPGADDAEGPLGYRLVVVSGVVPDSITSMLGVDLAGSEPLFLRPSFEEVPALDLVLRAVAIDAAGNESAPTEPFRIQFDGCTLAAVGDECEDEVDPASDLSALVDGTGVAEEAALDTPSAGMGCSLLAPHASQSWPSGVVFLGVAIALARRLRRGSARRAL